MRTIAFIALIIACYYFTYYIYSGLIQPVPALGDSWDYHIPISKSILDGSFLNPDYNLNKQYFPGSSEAINSVFILLNIPLTVSNILAIVVLAIACYKLARTFNLDRYYALLFALTFVTLTAVVRWMNAISIDVWVVVYFIFLIVLLEKPKKTLTYFLLLGFLSGMMIGSKYNAVIYLILLFTFYARTLISIINFQKVIVFLIPFSIFGLFWYARNYIAVQNPFYPLSYFGMPGEKDFGGYTSGDYTIWKIMLNKPWDMFNAAFGEYKFWLFSIFIVVWALVNQFGSQKKTIFDGTTRIFLLGTISFILFLGYPTDENTWIMVSSFRYSFPAFVLVILGVFIVAAKYKKEMWLGYLAIAGMINVLTMEYYPKLILIYFPLALLIFYFF